MVPEALSAKPRRTIRRGDRRSRRGFTLVELIVGGVVVSIIGAGIIMSVTNMVKAKNKSVARHQAFSRADAAGARIATDVATAVRSSDLSHCKVQVTDGGVGPVQRDGLLVLHRSNRLVRGRDDIPEGGEYEAQYRVDGQGSTAGLWRRADPAFDRALDAGGVAMLLAPGVVSFSVQASDGVSWFDTWDSDSEGFPHAVRVEIRAVSDDLSAEAVVRRVIALDRVPTPPDASVSSSASPSTTAPAPADQGNGGAR